jgi:hypothetical protein
LCWFEDREEGGRVHDGGVKGHQFIAGNTGGLDREAAAGANEIEGAVPYFIHPGVLGRVRKDVKNGSVDLTPYRWERDRSAGDPLRKGLRDGVRDRTVPYLALCRTSVGGEARAN